MTTVRIYTDGASWANGMGGWAALMFIDGQFSMGRYGGRVGTTNNQMEMQGLIAGLEMLPTEPMKRCQGCGVVPQEHAFDTEFCKELGALSRPIYDDAVIVSDSQYCIKGATVWVHGWKKNGWKTADKKPVKNQSLWEAIDALTKICAARFEWVKGHGTDPGNILADHFAVEGKKYVSQHEVAEWDARIHDGQVAKILAKIKS